MSLRQRALISLLVPTSAIAACTTAVCGVDRQSANADLRQGALRGANVLVVTIDTLRADRVGAFGGSRPTPTLDRLAAGGLRFTRAYAHAPMTLPAHASMFTGLIPPRHGVRVNGSELEASVPTLAELLGRSGYRTGAFVGSFVLDGRFGLSRGFGVYDDRVGTEHGPVTFGFVERPADRVLRAAADWLLRPSTNGSPWFAWVHLFDPHTPYRAPRTIVDSPYDNEIAFADAELGSFLEELRRAGLLSRTLIVVLSDHGEGLGDHGEETHGLFAYESTLRIPFIINGPGLHPAAITVPAAQADLLPTIADLLGLEPFAGLDGRSLLPAIRGDESGHDTTVYFEALDAHLTRNWAPLKGIVSGGWKYIDLPIPELFDLSRDPGEQTNRAAEDVTRATELARRLEALQREEPPRAVRELDPDAAARLRSLGYTASAAPARQAPYTEADDPKRLIEVDRRFQAALHMVGDGRHAEAVALLQEAIDRRPDFTAAYLALASIYVETGRSHEAVNLLRGGMQRGLSDPKLGERLGAALLASGEPARAAAVLEPLSGEKASVDTLNTLAIVHAEMGARDRARALFERALVKAPRAASIWNNLGLLELAARRLPEAARAFERAVTEDPAFAPAWTALGATHANGDRARAIDAWTRAVELSPADYDTLFNLGMLLWQSGRRDEARPYLERFVREAPPSRYSADQTGIRRLLAGHDTNRPPR